MSHRFSRLSRVGAAAVAFLTVVAGAGTSFADVSAENRAAAQALFDEGRSLIKANKAQEACSKFEESERLDPSVGTQLNLADCYERTGRTASAWTQYIDVAQAARQAGQEERASHAAARVAALKDKLSRLSIVVPVESRAPGLKVERGSLSVGEAQWGAAMPVDPGGHTVTVSAPGKKPWTTTVTLAADGSTKIITVPPLENAPKGAAVTPANDSPATSIDLGAQGRDAAKLDGSQKTIAYVVGAVGVAGLAVGGIFGEMAIAKKNDANCSANLCNGEGPTSTYAEAQKVGNLSTVAFIAGGALLAGGAVLYLTAPKRGTTTGAGFGARASIGPGTVGIAAGATW